MRSLKETLNKGQLSVTQKRGVITCIPKGDKPRQYLKNWRPITLLNTDYKLLSACLANRLKNNLHQIISSSQKGFLKDRFIGENTRLVYDIMQYLEQQNKKGLIVMADFEKAFDSVEWEYLEKTLKAYNFGDTFISWFKTLYSEPESCVINCRHFSEFFKLERGCDPLSPYLFLLAIEPLAISMKNNTEMEGIKVGEIVYKVGQYADDTFLLLDGEETSLRTALQIFKDFEQCSGLKLNIEKTIVSWLGSKRGSLATLCSELNLQWKKPFKLLGIYFNTLDVDSSIEINLRGKLVSISGIMQQYRRRNLSILGKITVVKTIIIAQLVHIFSVLPSPSKEFVKELNELIYVYIWNHKK